MIYVPESFILSVDYKTKSKIEYLAYNHICEVKSVFFVSFNTTFLCLFSSVMCKRFTLLRISMDFRSQGLIPMTNAQ